MSEFEYQQALNNQTKYHDLMQQADYWEREGDLPKAILYHEKAFEMAKGSNSEPVSRGELARLYEANGDYRKALEQINWFVKHSNNSSPLWSNFLASQRRLLPKIEEQKKKGNGDNVVDEIKKEFPKASPEQQKRFLETFNTEGVEGVYRSAFLAEQGRDFKKALGLYESLLPRKEDIVKAFTSEEGWVMLHPAVQRMSEATGDEAREKEMLVWIWDNMFTGQGQYHKYLKGLMPPVQDHLKERLKKFGLIS